MLTHTFQHIGGVTASREKLLWQAGLDWDSPVPGPDCLPPKTVSRLEEGLRESRERLAAHDLAWFARHLDQKEHWRLFRHFRDRAAYFDIETTGGTSQPDYTTVASLYDGHEIMVFTKGRNMARLPEALARYDIIVTFNGRCFDLPFVREDLGAGLPLVSLDLRFVFAGLGLKGGLKKLEKQFGIDRKDCADLDGYAAVKLWGWHLRGEKGALETLTAYNIMDTVNLERLACLAYNMKCAATGIPGLAEIPEPPSPEIPIRPYGPMVSRALRATGFKDWKHRQ